MPALAVTTVRLAPSVSDPLRAMLKPSVVALVAVTAP